MRHRTFFARLLAATAIGTVVATSCWGEEPARRPAVNPSITTPQDLAPFSLDSYRQRIEHLLPKGWSIKTGKDELTVAKNEAVLIGHTHANPCGRTDEGPWGLSIDGEVYLPGKGDPKKMVYVDEPNLDRPEGIPQPKPYHLAEPTANEAAPKARDDVSYRHIEYAVTIRFLPLVSMEEYRRLIDANKATTAKANAIYRQLRSRRVTVKFDDFAPGSPEEKELVDQYEHLKKSIHSLPRFRTVNRTVDISDPLAHWAFFFANDQVGEQAESVISGIERMFEQYPAAD
jgi:hypothetical protein